MWWSGSGCSHWCGWLAVADRVYLQRGALCLLIRLVLVPVVTSIRAWVWYSIMVEKHWILRVNQTSLFKWKHKFSARRELKVMCGSTGGGGALRWLVKHSFNYIKQYIIQYILQHTYQTPSLKKRSRKMWTDHEVQACYCTFLGQTCCFWKNSGCSGSDCLTPPIRFDYILCNMERCIGTSIQPTCPNKVKYTVLKAPNVDICCWSISKKSFPFSFSTPSDVWAHQEQSTLGSSKHKSEVLHRGGLTLGIYTNIFPRISSDVSLLCRRFCIPRGATLWFKSILRWFRWCCTRPSEFCHL